MEVLRAILATVFILMGVGIAMESWRVRRLGLMFGAVVYAAGGASSFGLGSWWPLVAGFAAAWSLRLMGADPLTDLRFDLPVLDRAEVTDANRLNEYAEAWLSTDTQVALVASRFVNEAWDRGFRRPAHIPVAPEWSAGTAVEAWKQMVGTDLRRVASSTKEAMIQYIDELGELSMTTLIVAGEATAQYDLPTAPSHFSIIEGKILDPQRRAEYAAAVVGDALLSARERVLGWTFQHWYGERYRLPETRDAHPKTRASGARDPASVRSSGDDEPDNDGNGAAQGEQQNEAVASDSQGATVSPFAGTAPTPAPVVGKPFQFRATGGVHTLPGALELADGSIVIPKDAQADFRARLASERELATNFKTLRREMHRKLAAAQRAAEDGKIESDAIVSYLADLLEMTPDERFAAFEQFDADIPKLRLEIEKQKLQRERAALPEERTPTPAEEEAAEARQSALQTELHATYTRVIEHPSVKALNPDDVNAVFRKHAARAERLVSKEPDGSEMFDDAEVLEDLEILVANATSVRPPQVVADAVARAQLPPERVESVAGWTVVASLTRDGAPPEKVHDAIANVIANDPLFAVFGQPGYPLDLQVSFPVTDAPALGTMEATELMWVRTVAVCSEPNHWIGRLLNAPRMFRLAAKDEYIAFSASNRGMFFEHVVAKPKPGQA